MFFHSNKLLVYKRRRKTEKSRRCEVCNVDVHRASTQKHLRTTNQLENGKHIEMIIPERFFKEQQAPFNKKTNKVFNHKTLN